jgi:hypothetical protein
MSARNRRAALSAAFNAITTEAGGIAAIRFVSLNGLQALVADALTGDGEAQHTLGLSIAAASVSGTLTCPLEASCLEQLTLPAATGPNPSWTDSDPKPTFAGFDQHVGAEASQAPSASSSSRRSQQSRGGCDCRLPGQPIVPLRIGPNRMKRSPLKRSIWTCLIGAKSVGLVLTVMPGKSIGNSR